MKILLVEDAKESLYMLEFLLTGGGYEVVSAKNGVEALKKLRKETIDIIISDILMPKMDGFQLCRACKTDDSLKKIPFVFYTATYTDKKDEDFALSLGAEKFIVKPEEPGKFLKILEGVIKDNGKRPVVAQKKPDMGAAVYLEEHNEILTRKLEKKMLDINQELTERKQMDVKLRQISETLRAEREILMEKNIALKQILEHIEEARATFKHEISASVEQMLMPFLKKLKTNDGFLDPKDVDRFEHTLNAVIRKDIEEFRYNYATLSPREVEICELITNGISTKQISSRLHLSPLTVHKHRELIRRKLRLKNKNINLATYLRSKRPAFPDTT